MEEQVFILSKYSKVLFLVQTFPNTSKSALMVVTFVKLEDTVLYFLSVCVSDRQSFTHSPSRSSFTSLAAFSPSSRRFLSIIFDLSAAAFSSWLTVQPMFPSARFRTAADGGNSPGEKSIQPKKKRNPKWFRRGVELSKATSPLVRCESREVLLIRD